MNDDLLHRLLRDTHLLASLVRSVFEEGFLREACGGRVTFTQLSILRMLGSPGRHHIGDVAHFLDVSYAAASKLVDRMKARKLLRGTPYAGDRRAETLEPTAAGLGLVARYDRLKLARVRAKLKGTPLSELTALSGALERLLALFVEGSDREKRACLRCDAFYTAGCVLGTAAGECPYRKGNVARKIAQRALKV
jgi:DNA-binding MarR family transcriptional regulator